MNTPSVRQRLDTLFEPYNRSDAPGLVVGVRHRGALIYRRGFGLASIEHSVANTPATLMRIGSTTKHFTCLAILLLEQDGKLDISHPVRTYLPELDNCCGEPTLLQLMHHTGGLPDTSAAALLANGGYFGHTPPGGAIQILRKFRSLNFVPGTRLAYNNDGYTLLSLIIERLGGLSWNDFVTRRLLAPLGMTNTMLVRSDLDIVRGMATLHLAVGDTWRRGIFFSDDLLGAGGLVSTVDDMLRWTAHLRGTDESIFGNEIRKRLLEPQRFANGTTIGYGLGLMREQLRGVDIIHHAGATMGAQSQMLIAPAHELDIVIMSNRMDAAAQVLALQAMEAVLGEEGLAAETAPAAAADHPALAGRWFSRESQTLLSIEAVRPQPQQAETLLLSVHHAPAGALRASGTGLARPAGASSSVEIRKPPTDGAPPPVLDVHICGELERFERLPATPPAIAELASNPCGRYRHAEFAKEVEIRLDDGRLVLDLLPMSGGAHWELEAFADDVFGCGRFRAIPEFPLPLPATLTLDRRDGEVRGFWLNMDRMRRLRFERC